MSPPSDLSILIIDDDEVDRMRVRRFLITGARQSFALQEAVTAEEGLTKLRENTYDCVLLDLRLPDRDGLDVLREMNEALDDPPPVILETVVNEESLGLEAIGAGAQDYLAKGHFDAQLLVRTIRYAIQRHKLLREKERLVRDLEKAAADIRQLSGMLPICCNCKKIRDDAGYWRKVEEFIASHSHVQFSHGICPECAKALYPDMPMP